MARSFCSAFSIVKLARASRAGPFSFTAAKCLRQGRRVRLLILLLCLTVCVGSARGQVQEGKLVDRLLRPNVTLANSSQDKKFTAAGGTSVDKKFVAKSFYSGAEPSTRSFWGVKNFFARDFGTKKFARGDATANARSNAETAYATTQFETKKSDLIRTSAEEKKTAKVREYAESRPFLGHGTRQKILSQQDHPLTIDEIRELLNRNK